MNCKVCDYEMVPVIKPEEKLLDMAADTHTWVYWRYFRCPECGWQYMANDDKIFNLAEAVKVIKDHYGT